MSIIIKDDSNFNNFNDDSWWKQNKSLHESISGFLRNRELYHNYITHKNQVNYRLYGNRDFNVGSVGSKPILKTRKHLILNLVRSIVDTIVAKISSNSPKLSFLVEDGSWFLQKKAKKLESFTYGLMKQSDVYSQASYVLRDACVFGKGFFYFYWDGINLKAERVFPEEIKVDEHEAMYGEPRQIHRIKYVSKDLLISKFPKFEKQIKDAPRPKHIFMSDDRMRNICELRESWHLPDHDGNYGIHCLTIYGADLFVERYEEDFLPFCWFDWSKDLTGFWSTGIADIVKPIQIEINKVMRRINEAIDLGIIPKIFLERGSKVVDAHINNEVGGIIEYSGRTPTNGPLLTIPQDLKWFLQDMYIKAYELSGVSQLSAQSKNQPKLTSGVALREFNDIETERFLDKVKNYENFYVEIGKKMLKMCKIKSLQLEANGLPDISTITKFKENIEKINWKDVEIDEDQYLIQVYPTSLFSKEPAAKLSQVIELFSIGVIDKEKMLDLLQFPDLEKQISLETARLDDLMATIDSIVYEGIYYPPEPFQDLIRGIELAQASYLKYKNKKVPVEHLALLRKWIDDALDLINPQAGVEDVENQMMEQEEAQNQAMQTGMEIGRQANIQKGV